MPPKADNKEKYDEFLKAWNEAFAGSDLDIDPEIFSDMERFFIYEDRNGRVDIRTPFYSKNLAMDYDPGTNPKPHQNLLLEHFNADDLTAEGIRCFVFKPKSDIPYELIISRKDGKTAFELKEHKVSIPQEKIADPIPGFISGYAKESRGNTKEEHELHEAGLILKAANEKQEEIKEKLKNSSPQEALDEITNYLSKIRLPEMNRKTLTQEDITALVPAAEYAAYLKEHPELQGLSEEARANLAAAAGICELVMNFAVRHRSLVDKEMPALHLQQEYFKAQMDLVILKMIFRSVRKDNEKNVISFGSEAKQLLLSQRQKALRDTLSKDAVFWKHLNNKDPYIAGESRAVMKAFDKAAGRAQEIYKELPKEPAPRQNAAQPQQNEPLGRALAAQNMTKLQRKGDAYMTIARQSLEGRGQEISLNRLQEKLAPLNETLAMLSTRREGQDYPVLDTEQINTLKKQYREALDACTAVKKISEKNQGLFRAMSQMETLLRKDLKRIEAYREEMKISLPFLLQSSKMEAINLDSMDHGPVLMHGQMSQRMAMTLDISDGDHKTAVSGLFTEASFHLNEKHALDMYFSQNPQYSEFFAILAKRAQESEMTIDKMFNHLEVSEKNTRHTISINAESRLKDDPEFVKWFNSVCLVGKHKDTVNEGTYQIFREIKDVLSKAYTEGHIGIQSGRRLDQRNCAMYDIASFLGMPQLIARAVPAIIRKDGREINGTFMEFAKGEDSRSLKKDSHFALITDDDLNNNHALLQQASDLQVIDFICGNTDRHGGNMFYQFDKSGNLTGIQGIDNDMSFGIIGRDSLLGKIPIGNFTGLSAMKFVSKKTAKKILSVTPEMLKLQLSHYGLTRFEINAAAERLVMLQEALDARYIQTQNPPAFQPKDLSQPQDANHPRVYILSDKQIKQIKLNDVLPPKKPPLENGRKDKTGQNTFDHLKNELLISRDDMILYAADKDSVGVHFQRSRTVIEKIQKNSRNGALPKVSVSIRKHFFDPVKYTEKMHLEVEELESCKGFSPSQEYKNVLEYARVVRNKFETMDSPSEENFRTACTMMENLDDLCTVYLDKKREEGTLKKDRAVQHVFAVQHLQNMVKNACTKFGEADKDCYRRLSQAQRSGAIRYSRDSAAAAQRIHALKNADERTFDAKNEQLTMIFDGAAKSRCAEALEGYAQQIGCLSDAKGVSDELKKELINLAINIQSMIQINQKKESASMEDVERTKALIAQFREKPELKEERFRHIDCGLGHVQWRIESGLLSKPSLKEQLAERLVIRASQNPDHPENKDFVKDHQSFLNAKNRILSSREFAQMTARKTAAQLKDMITEPEDKLTEKYNAGPRRRQAAR